MTTALRAGQELYRVERSFGAVRPVRDATNSIVYCLALLDAQRTPQFSDCPENPEPHARSTLLLTETSREVWAQPVGLHREPDGVPVQSIAPLAQTRLQCRNPTRQRPLLGRGRTPAPAEYSQVLCCTDCAARWPPARAAHSCGRLEDPVRKVAPQRADTMKKDRPVAYRRRLPDV